MKYWVVAVVDAEGKVSSLIHFETSLGRVALVFTDKAKAEEAATYAEHFVIQPEKRIVFWQIEASPSQLLAVLQEDRHFRVTSNLGLTYLIEGVSDSFFDDVFAYIREQNRTVQPEQPSNRRRPWRG